MAKQITIRNVPKELSRQLARLAESRGQSLNATVLEVLEQATGIDARRVRLARYTTWTKADVEELDEALRLQRVVDPKLWETR